MRNMLTACLYTIIGKACRPALERQTSNSRKSSLTPNIRICNIGTSARTRHGMNPSYWCSGIRPTFRLGAQLAAIRYGVDKYFELFSRVGCLFDGLLAFVLLQARPANFFKQFRKSFLLWMPAIAGLANYSVIHVEDRFLGGFLLLLWAASFMSVRIRPAQHSVARAITWSIVLVLGIQSAWPVGHAAVRLATLLPSADAAVAKQLRDEEINAGDKVAFVNSALLDHY